MHRICHGDSTLLCLYLGFLPYHHALLNANKAVSSCAVLIEELVAEVGATPRTGFPTWFRAIPDCAGYHRSIGPLERVGDGSAPQVNPVVGAVGVI